MNLPPDTRSKPHNLLLVAITEGKPKNLQLMFSAFNDLQDFFVGNQLWRSVVCFTFLH